MKAALPSYAGLMLSGLGGLNNGEPSPWRDASAPAPDHVLFGVLVLLSLLGISGVLHGGQALVRNVRQASSSGRWHWLFVALAAGAVLAVGTLFACYPYGGTGRICGFPFPAGTPSWAHIGRGLPTVYSAALGFVDPLAYPVQLANLAFAFLLPQLVLRRWLRKERARVLPGAAEKGRHRRDVLLLIPTIVLVLAYVPFVAMAPGRLERLPSWRSVALDWAIIVGPSGCALLGWCMASLWLWDGGVTIRGRIVWASALIFAVLGLPISFLYFLVAP